MITPEQFVKEVVGSWSLKQVMEAVDGLKKELGISDLAVAAPAAAAPTAAAAPVEEKTEFGVFLKGLSDPKMKTKVVLLVKTVAEASLPDAKKMVEGASPETPCELKAGLPQADAKSLKEKVEAVGGIVEIK
jgi:large subunit ribosomal protein L7/L12